MPWNLPLWWQLRRLRVAIEIDCDARVLRRGYDVTHYGETLIAVGERQSATIAMVAAMSEPRSLLEQRIRNMLRKKTKHAHATALALACLGIAFAVGAAEINPPNNGEPVKSASQESAADTRIRDGHVGFYQLNDNAVLAITRNGQQLNAQLTGQPDGQTTSLILRQHGIDMPMKRIDAATAQRIASIRVEQRYRPRPDRVGALIILR